MVVCPRIVGLVVCALAAAMASTSALGQGLLGTVFPEQQRMEIRSPSQMPVARLPDVPTPPTVSAPLAKEPLHLSLDEAIRIALEDSEVVRVLSGTGATSSGSTIYDPAITNTEIDEARARFDPGVEVLNDWDRTETPGAADYRPSDTDPHDVRIDGTRIDQYNLGLGVSKTTSTGGAASLGVNANPLRSSVEDLPLNPRATSSVEMGFSQPLLQGGGIRANLAPIEIARIDTERSFYALKQSVQQLVRGVIEAYWALVFARVEVWARRQQLKQGQWAYDFAQAQFRRGLGNAGDRAQAQASLARFRANTITARASLLRREAALRNILGMSPTGPEELVPVTPPSTEWIAAEWETVLRIAEEFRPDLVELKLQIESDEQQLLMAQNEALPQVDANALYRWDALGGRDPTGAWIASGPGQFTGWQFGIDLTVPLGLRQSRAALRRVELSLMRDRANLEQGLHAATHLLAENYRNLAQYHEEYRAFRETRQAARTNLDAQSARWAADLAIYLNVLQALTSWGDAIDAEAQSLLQYNTEFASLQEQMGTILEVHGVRFVEEPYCSMGPLGRKFPGRWYPRARRPGSYDDQYERGTEPAENAFELDEPVIPTRRDLDRPRPPIPTPGAALQAPPDALVPPRPDTEPPPLPTPAQKPEETPTPAETPERTQDSTYTPKWLPVPEPRILDLP